MIGPLGMRERITRVRAYWEKKKKRKLLKDQPNKYHKKKRQADKKLRVNGKFVSLKQAKSLIKMTKKEFK